MRAKTSHDGQLWERLYQLIKVEEPVTLQSIQHWCAGVKPWELVTTLNEMCAARKISVFRQWSHGRLIETYFYGDCPGAGVVIVADEPERLSHRSWRQQSLWGARTGASIGG